MKQRKITSRNKNFIALICCLLFGISTGFANTITNSSRDSSADTNIDNKTTKSVTATPNILFILVDDLGWMDLSHYGSDLYQTPNIDALAKSGMSFNQAYTAAHICSPTRMSILTGQHPARLKVTDWIPGWDYPNEKLTMPKWRVSGLATSDTTIGEVLKAQGYKTAWLGKWHVRGQAAENSANTEQSKAAQLHGFDAGEQDFSLNKQTNNSDPKAIIALTNQAIKFIDNSAKNNSPWFVTISHYAVHTPIRFTNALKDKYDQIDKSALKQTNSEYAALMESLDNSVGQIMAHLTQQKLVDNTLVVFYSDNGGLDKNDNNTPTNNAPLRNGKATLYEGGIRVPLIVSWPDKIAKNVWNNSLITSTDLLPTFANIAKIPATKLPKNLDGIDISPALFTQQTLKRNELFWHYPHYHRQGKPSGSIRQNNYKLIESFEDGSLELYDLANDISESTNVAKTQPALAQQLLQRLNQWRKEVGAQMMTKKLNH